MEHMQEDNFDKIPKTEDCKNCNHEVVKLYDLGSHSDYGCVKCGMQSSILEDFKK